MNNFTLTEDNFDKLPNKTITIRRGKKDIDLGSCYIFSSEEGRRARVKVLRVEYCELWNIYKADLNKDGFRDWNHAFDGLKKYYPDIKGDELFTIIHFKTIEILDDKEVK